MFGKQIKLMSLFGFDVKIDMSWIFLAFLIIWTLTSGYFPSQIEGLSPASYWWMGIFGALGLFFSIVFHEFSHSLVARKMGLPMKGITLFIFGGVAEMGKEPENPKTEFWMAIAGPLASIFLGLLLLGFETVTSLPVIAEEVVSYLWKINFILAGFNLLPGFPLDGGRIFRSALWAWKKDFKWATHWAVKSGSFLGTLLIILGVIAFLGGGFVAGVWWILIALFLKGAARSSEIRMIIRDFLKGVPVKNYMISPVVFLSPKTTLEDAIQNYFYRYHHRYFPVVEGGKLLGLLGVEQIKGIPRSEWKQTFVEKVFMDLSSSNSVSKDTDALEAFQKMQTEGVDTLLVYDGQLGGLLTRKDLLTTISMKLDLEKNWDTKLLKLS